MAETFKMLNQSLTTAEANVYVCPSATQAIIFLAQAANSDGANSADITMFATDSSATSKKYLTRTIPIPADAASSFLTGKLVLEAGDYLSGLASSNNHIDVTLSILEIT
jgi:hypothetical protein